MTIADFISHLQSLDVRLSAEGERLRVNAPKGVLTKSLRAQIADHKHKLLDFLRGISSPTAFNPPRIVRRMDANPAPLSFAQERLWFLEQLEPGSPLYNICRAYRLTGELNRFALERSLNEIVRRHEVLRSAVRLVDGLPVQVVEPPYELKLSCVDLRAVSDVEREQNIRQHIQEAAEAPFDFTVGKFLRAELLGCEDDQQVLILATHHMVSDAWSMGILTRELWSLYETYAAGKSSALEELPVQYVDFAIWQRDGLRGEVLESQLSYWKEHLNDLAILNLPSDRRRPPRQTFRGARVPISLTESLTRSINDLSNECGVTPFMTLLAVFQVLLYRYSGQEDITVGSPVANRSRTELEPLIGFFVNTLVLRSDLSGNPTFKELLARVRDVCLAAYEHQDLPFEKLVQELQPERDQSRNPLFQVMFALQNATHGLSPFDGLEIEPLEAEGGRSLFDLSLFLRERDRKYIGYFEYSTDLLEASTIRRMVGHIQQLLEGIVADSEQRISMLPLLSDAERHQLLVEWNDTAADYPKDKCIHQLFEEQVQRTPDRIVISFNDQQLTYRELNARANQLAHYLRGLGVGPETLVGICVERSLEMVVGLLGILKSGGAYLPLDPTYPKERLRFMLEDAQLSLVLTQQRLVEDGRLKIGNSGSSILDSRLTIVRLDRDWPAIQHERAANPRIETESENLAYVIYTSGSTGKPKGVQISHWSIVNCLYSIAQRLRFTERDVLVAITTISFDIAGLELFLPLLVGGTLVVVSREEVTDGPELARRVKECSATVMQATPSTWRMLIDSGWRGSLEFQILCGGESLSRELAEALLTRGQVWNLYGPTETTIWSTIHILSSGEGPVPIGRPIANTQVYILDSHFQAVPIGVYGELYIGGAGVSRGYLNRPELTKEKFIRNPFIDASDSRLYRTGDVARYLPDGNIHFFGRFDNQIKLRGYRIELGEVEAVLNQHPTVKQSVAAICDRTAPGSDNPKSKIENLKSLVAYVVPKQQPAPSSGELREYLKGELPEYMVPSLFVTLDALPLTVNGKVDRNTLPASQGVKRDINQGLTERRTEIEESVAQAWCEILNHEKVNIYDNFFELGGHSLVATQIVARLRNTFDREIPLRVLFDAPTVEDMSREIEMLLRDSDQPAGPAIVPVPREAPLRLAINQEHLWRLDHMVPGTHFFNMPYVYRLSGTLNIPALERSLSEIINRHEALRTVFVELGNCPAQIIEPAVEFVLPYFDLRGSNAVKVSQRIGDFVVDERNNGFDLAKGPLLRAKLLRAADTEYFLLLTLHHIIGDLASVHILRREMFVFYDAFSHGRSLPFVGYPMQFSDFVAWERQYLKSEWGHEAYKYWSTELEGCSPCLPLDEKSGRSVPLHQGCCIHERKKASGGAKHDVPAAALIARRMPLTIHENLFSGISNFARRQRGTPFLVALTALAALIHRRTCQQDIRIGTLVANRTRREIEGTIGHFINTIVIRARIDRAMTLDQLFCVMRRKVMLGYVHQEFPFEYLARELEKKEKLPRASLFNVLLIYRRGPSEITQLPGLSIAPMAVRQTAPGSDLTISAHNLVFELTEESTMLTGTINYRIDKLSSQSARRLRRGFQELLTTVVSYPGASVGPRRGLRRSRSDIPDLNPSKQRSKTR